MDDLINTLAKLAADKEAARKSKSQRQREYKQYMARAAKRREANKAKGIVPSIGGVPLDEYRATRQKSLSGDAEARKKHEKALGTTYHKPYSEDDPRFAAAQASGGGPTEPFTSGLSARERLGSGLVQPSSAKHRKFMDQVRGIGKTPARKGRATSRSAVVPDVDNSEPMYLPGWGNAPPALAKLTRTLDAMGSARGLTPPERLTGPPRRARTSTPPPQPTPKATATPTPAKPITGVPRPKPQAAPAPKAAPKTKATPTPAPKSDPYRAGQPAVNIPSVSSALPTDAGSRTGKVTEPTKTPPSKPIPGAGSQVAPWHTKAVADVFSPGGGRGGVFGGPSTGRAAPTGGRPAPTSPSPSATAATPTPSPSTPSLSTGAAPTGDWRSQVAGGTFDPGAFLASRAPVTRPSAMQDFLRNMQQAQAPSTQLTAPPTAPATPPTTGQAVDPSALSGYNLSTPGSVAGQLGAASGARTPAGPGGIGSHPGPGKAGPFGGHVDSMLGGAGVPRIGGQAPTIPTGLPTATASQPPRSGLQQPYQPPTLGLGGWGAGRQDTSGPAQHRPPGTGAPGAANPAAQPQAGQAVQPGQLGKYQLQPPSGMSGPTGSSGPGGQPTAGALGAAAGARPKPPIQLGANNPYKVQ